MDVTDHDIENLKRISKQVFADRDNVEVEKVKCAGDSVVVKVKSVDEEATIGTRNAFAGDNLYEFIDNGYVAVAVGGGDTSHSAWFERADAVDFGSPDPSGEHELIDDWTVSIDDDNAIGGDRAVLKHDGTPVAHIKRDGWRLDEYVLRSVLSVKVKAALEDIGFKEGDIDT